MTALTRLSVQNMALDALRQAPLSYADDTGSPEGRYMARNYDVTRDMILRSHTWNFAVKRAALSADADKPEFGWEYQYTRPADTIRILPLTHDGEINGYEIPYVVEGDKILTDEEAPLWLRYVSRVEEEGRWDPLFAQVLALTLAKGLAPSLTGKETTIQRISNDLNGVLAQARLSDALEGIPEPVIDDEIIRVRYT
jgi:hypothetical protein